MMNFIKRFILVLFSLLCLFATNIKAELWTPETLPMVHLQDSLRFVCNPDGVLSAETVAATDAILNDLKQKKGVETVVVVVKRIKGGDTYQFGMDLSRKYGIGSKEQRSGLILILSTEDRKYRILTGHGLEGTLPDGLCYNIEQKVMVPALKKNQWNQAIYATVSELSKVIQGDESLRRHYNQEEDYGGWVGLAFVLSMVIFILLILRASNTAKHRCPACKQKDVFFVQSTRRVRKGNRWYTESLWCCRHCGHMELRETDDTDDINGGAFIPPFFMGGGSHGGGGGGFSGGSFGGGSFGGGGAGGDF